MKPDHPFSFVYVVAIMAVLSLVVLARFEGCQVDDESARKTIESQGFTRVELGGTSPLTCSDGENSRAFTATNSNRTKVKGVVCCGWSGCAKGCTLRW